MSKRNILLVILSAASILINANILCAQNSRDLLIWFDKPADKFTQSLPLGNGRLGQWFLAELAKTVLF